MGTEGRWGAGPQAGRRLRARVPELMHMTSELVFLGIRDPYPSVRDLPVHLLSLQGVAGTPLDTKDSGRKAVMLSVGDSSTDLCVSLCFQG